jgi:hypothetical protein
MAIPSHPDRSRFTVEVRAGIRLTVRIVRMDEGRSNAGDAEDAETA